MPRVDFRLGFGLHPGSIRYHITPSLPVQGHTKGANSKLTRYEVLLLSTTCESTGISLNVHMSLYSLFLLTPFLQYPPTYPPNIVDSLCYVVDKGVVVYAKPGGPV